MTETRFGPSDLYPDKPKKRNRGDRFTITLSRREGQWLRFLAEKDKRSNAEYIKKALDLHMNKRVSKNDLKNADPPWEELGYQNR